jgi:zinc protease
MPSSCPNIQSAQTHLGATSWVISNAHLPLVSACLCFKNAGDQSDQILGTATVLSSMLSEGCGDLDSQAFKEFLLENNIQLSISCDLNHIFISFRTLKEALPKTMELISTILTSPRFDLEAFKKVTQQYSGQLAQALHDEKTIASEVLLKFAIGDHPYAHTTESTINQLPKVTIDGLKAHWKRCLAQDNLFAAVCGDISLEEWSSLFQVMIKTLPEKADCSEIPSVSLKNAGKVHHHSMDVPQSIIGFVLPMIPRTDPDFYAAQILNSLFGGTAFISRLWSSVREKGGHAYYIRTSLNLFQKGEWIAGKTATDTKAVETVRQLIEKDRESLLNGDVDEALLNEHREHLIGEYQLNFSSTQSIVSLLTAGYLLGLSTDETMHRSEQLKRVSLDDVKRVAKRLFAQKPTWVIVGRKAA